LNQNLAPTPYFPHAYIHDFYYTHHMFDEMSERAFIFYYSGLGERRKTEPLLSVV